MRYLSFLAYVMALVIGIAYGVQTEVQAQVVSDEKNIFVVEPHPVSDLHIIMISNIKTLIECKLERNPKAQVRIVWPRRGQSGTEWVVTQWSSNATELSNELDRLGSGSVGPILSSGVAYAISRFGGERSEVRKLFIFGTNSVCPALRGNRSTASQHKISLTGVCYGKPCRKTCGTGYYLLPKFPELKAVECPAPTETATSTSTVTPSDTPTATLTPTPSTTSTASPTVTPSNTSTPVPHTFEPSPSAVPNYTIYLPELTTE